MNIVATYEDAVRLEEIVNSILVGGQASAAQQPEYAELIQRFVTENDEQIAAFAGSMHLPSTLEQLAADTQPRRDNMLTSTGFTKGMRAIKDILIARKRRDDRLVQQAEARSEDVQDSEPHSAASDWTGASTPMQRLASVRTLIPIAQGAVEQLIISLESNRHNGGPPLDDTLDALDALRKLHAALGALLTAADEGRLDQEYNEGLVVEAVRYAKRAARSIQSDPLRYATAATVLAILCACGFPATGAFLADVAFSLRRPSAK